MNISEKKARKAMTKLVSTNVEEVVNHIFENPNDYQDTPEEIAKAAAAAKEKAEAIILPYTCVVCTLNNFENPSQHCVVCGADAPESAFVAAADEEPKEEKKEEVKVPEKSEEALKAEKEEKMRKHQERVG